MIQGGTWGSARGGDWLSSNEARADLAVVRAERKAGVASERKIRQKRSGVGPPGFLRAWNGAVFEQHTKMVVPMFGPSGRLEKGRWSSDHGSLRLVRTMMLRQ